MLRAMLAALPLLIAFRRLPSPLRALRAHARHSFAARRVAALRLPPLRRHSAPLPADFSMPLPACRLITPPRLMLARRAAAAPRFAGDFPCRLLIATPRQLFATLRRLPLPVPCNTACHAFRYLPTFRLHAFHAVAAVSGSTPMLIDFSDYAAAISADIAATPRQRVAAR